MARLYLFATGLWILVSVVSSAATAEQPQKMDRAVYDLVLKAYTSANAANILEDQCRNSETSAETRENRTQSVVNVFIWYKPTDDEVRWLAEDTEKSVRDWFSGLDESDFNGGNLCDLTLKIARLWATQSLLNLLERQKLDIDSALQTIDKLKESLGE